ncbi:hypothetical protein [Streptomyces lydicus]|uniref:hypothetical protein n=1 Tax=Streptomyces lydicus TaxID=47763 RepID=UPI003428D295
MTDSLLHQTIESLENTLPELEAQERQLRSELEDVVRRVTSVRHALEHLCVLTGTAASTGRQDAPPAMVTTQAAVDGPAPAGPARDKVSQTSQSPDALGAHEGDVESTLASAVPAPRAAVSSSAKTSARKRTSKKPSAKKAAVSATAKARKATSKQASSRPASKEAGSLLEASLKVLRKSSVPMRAAEINAALGREATPGQIESVRNTLDRVAKQQKLVARPGRGTYAAL